MNTLIIAAFVLAVIAFAAGIFFNDREWKRRLRWHSSKDLLMFVGKDQYKVKDMNWFTYEWIQKHPPPVSKEDAEKFKV